MYGSGNELRLTGKHETASMNTFRAGVGDRGASIRIPTSAHKTGKGYFEDRRPASNVDPYVAGAMIVSNCVLNGDGKKELVDHYSSWQSERFGLGRKY